MDAGAVVDAANGISAAAEKLEAAMAAVSAVLQELRDRVAALQDLVREDRVDRDLAALLEAASAD